MNIDFSIVNASTSILNKLRNSAGIEETSGLITSLSFTSASQIKLLNVWGEKYIEKYMLK